MDQQNLQAWQGRVDTARGEISPTNAAMIQAVLGDPDECAPRPGAVLPPLWHWCAFPPVAPMRALGEDGHPRTGGFLPPVRLDRRMWAGGALEFVQPLHVGEAIRRHSRIDAVTEKTGAAGPMVLVTLTHEISGEAGPALRETQDIVYLRIPDKFRPPRAVPAPQDLAFCETVPMTETLLFRYSAITFNAHRIHYDRAYATGAERYPGLVVHGPLQASLLIAAAARHAGCAPDRFRFRGIHPMFAGGDLRVMGEPLEDGKQNLCTAAEAGHQGMQATATWEEKNT